RREYFSGTAGVRSGVCHPIEGLRKGEASQRALALGDLLDASARRGHTEKLHVSGHVRAEVDELAVGTRGRSFWDEIPIRRQVVHPTAFGRHAIQIHCCAVILFRLNYLIQALSPSEE